MKRLIGYCFALLSPLFVFGQQPLKGTVKYEIKFDMPKEDREQMEKYGVSFPNTLIVAANGIDANMKMISSKGVFMEILYTQGESYWLDKEKSKAYKMPKTETKEGQEKSTLTIRKTEGFETIAGHKCRKYIIEDANKKGQQVVFATSDYNVPKSVFKNMNMGSASNASVYEQIEGLVLKMTGKFGASTFSMTAQSITNVQPSAADLKIPAKYTIEPFNPMVIMGKMMGGGAPPSK